MRVGSGLVLIIISVKCQQLIFQANLIYHYSITIVLTTSYIQSNCLKVSVFLSPFSFLLAASFTMTAAVAATTLVSIVVAARFCTYGVALHMACGEREREEREGVCVCVREREREERKRY